MVVSSEFAQRREQFRQTIGQGVALFASTPIAIRNNDVEHEFRQDSDLFYLSGFDEPDSRRPRSLRAMSSSPMRRPSRWTSGAGADVDASKSRGRT